MKPETRRRWERRIAYGFALLSVATLTLILLTGLAKVGKLDEWEQHLALLRLCAMALCAIAALLFYQDARR